MDIKNHATLPNNLSSVWLTDQSGLLTDLHGLNDLTNDGAVLATGIKGDGADIERSDDDNLQAASASNLQPVDDWCVSFWITPESPLTTEYFLMKGNSAGVWIGVYLESDGALKLSHDNGTTNNVVSTGTGVIVAGNTYHIVAGRSGTTGLIYVDLVEEGNDTVTGDDLSTSDPFLISGRWTGGSLNTSPSRSYDGIISQICFWQGRFINSSERSFLNNSGNGIFYEDAVAQNSNFLMYM